MRRVADGVGAASEAMFPANDHGAPDWRDTQMVERTVSYLGELPPPTRRLVMFMFVVIELGQLALFSGVRRFSKMSVARRDRILRAWKRSPLPHHKLLADALKAQLCMMYLSHPKVQKHIGAWKTCVHPADPNKLPVRLNVYSATTKNGLREDIA